MNSAGNPETLADIVREMRNPPEDGTPGYYDDYHGDTCYDSLKIWADRIEAAAKRAHDIAAALLAAKGVYVPHPDPDNAPPPTAGNVAAMRNALLNARTRFASLALMESEWRTCAESHVREIDAALAAPARNCDCHECAWDAQREFRRVFRNPYGKPAPSGDDTEYWPLFVNWLFAKAEGGAE